MPPVKIMLIGPSRGGGAAVTNQIMQAMQQMPGLDARGFPTPASLVFYQNAFKDIEDPAQKTRLICQHIGMAALSECVVFRPQLILVMALAPMWPLFLEGARAMGVTVAHWLIEDFRHGPADELVPGINLTAKHYDLIFTIQKGLCHQALRSVGATNLHYLPTAASIAEPPSFGSCEGRGPQVDVSFVGYPYPNRIKLFEHLQNYGLKVYGPGWSRAPYTLTGMLGEDRWFSSEEEAEIIRNSKIGLNVHSTLDDAALIPANDFINPRTFTIPGQGTFQLVNESDLLGELFEVGREVETYRTLDELKGKLERFLRDDQARRAIAQAGYERVKSDHSFTKRIQQMLHILGM